MKNGIAYYYADLPEERIRFQIPFSDMGEGDLIRNFNSTKSLIDDTIKIFKLRFTGDWRFIVQYPRGNKEEIEF